MQLGQWKESERLLQVGIDALDAEMVRNYCVRITLCFVNMTLLLLLQANRGRRAPMCMFAHRTLCSAVHTVHIACVTVHDRPLACASISSTIYL
jgi:hypothetical protein